MLLIDLLNGGKNGYIIIIKNTRLPPGSLSSGSRQWRSQRCIKINGSDYQALRGLEPPSEALTVLCITPML